MNTQPITSGMDRIDIKAALERRGWSLRRLSTAHGYSQCVVGKTLQRPWPVVEWIIADVLGMKPWEIWPSRYPNGPVPPPVGSLKNTVNLNTGDAA